MCDEVIIAHSDGTIEDKKKKIDSFKENNLTFKDLTSSSLFL